MSKIKNSVPKNTGSHPWRKANSNLKNYSRKALAEKKKSNYMLKGVIDDERSVATSDK